VALLGMQTPFEDSLRLRPAPYDFGYAYADGFIVRHVQGFARRTQADAPVPQYCSHEYDVQSGRLLATVVTTFPGDFIARAYASVLQVVEMPYQDLAPPVRVWAAPVFTARAALLRVRHSWGAFLGAMTLLFVSATSIRLGLFLLFFLAYFGGYPAIQFQGRHYFPLEFMGWWAAGFVIHQLIATAAIATNSPSTRRDLIRRLGRATAIVMIPGAIVFGALLVGARWYQTRQAVRLFSGYIAADKVRLDNPATPLSRIDTSEWPQFVEVDLDERACGPRPAVTFRYDPAFPDGDFTRTMTVERPAAVAGTTRIFLPVFERFAGLRFSDARPGCVLGAYRFANLKAFPLLLGATLPPDWASRPLYQRLTRWERDRS
jgi:hypothetical protein